MSSSSTTARKTRRHPNPPPPSPKILHFPRTRRTRRRNTKPIAHLCPHSNPLLIHHQHYLSQKGKLENLFDQENETPVVQFDTNPKVSELSERRERVEQVEEDVNGGLEEEKWRFQAEMLRAECNFLRVEREFALKKLEKNRVKMEKTLRSAVQALVSGQDKIFEGKNVKSILEEEIQDLTEKLDELQKSSRSKESVVRSCGNFDKKACILQRRLEKLGGLSEKSSVKELQEAQADSNMSVMSQENDNHSSYYNSKIDNKSTDVDLVKEKMEVMLDRVEDYGSRICTTANSSVASSASTSKRIDHTSEFSTRQFYQEQILNEENKCSGRCKAIVKRIMDQVRAETEQWTQMQAMLGQVRGEMEELQKSRDFWENQAHTSDYEAQSLKQAMEEWKEKALRYELKANELQNELVVVKSDLRESKEEIRVVPVLPFASLGKQLLKEKIGSSCRFNRNERFDENRGKVRNPMEELNMEEIKERTRVCESPPISLGKQLANEKRMFLRRFKENRHVNNEKGCTEEVVAKERTKSKRSPLRDIENSSCFVRENGRGDFTFLCSENNSFRDSFRK